MWAREMRGRRQQRRSWRGGVFQRQVPLEDGEDGLGHGEREQEYGGGEGECRPGIAEVGVDEVGPPLVHLLAAVLVHLAVDVVEPAVRVQRHVLGQGVEQPRHLLVAADGVVEDGLGVEEADVGGGVDDVVHEEDVGGDLVAGAGVEALEGHEVEEGALGEVVHHHHREAEHPVLEVDVPEAVAFAELELDARLVQLRRRSDDVRHDDGLLAAGSLPLLLPLVGDGLGDGPVEQALTVDIEEMEAAGDTALFGEDQERQLVLHHEHVPLDDGHGVEHPVPAEYGILAAVVRVVGLSRREDGGAAGRTLSGGGLAVPHDLQHEAPVQDHQLQEPLRVLPPLLLEPGVGVHQLLLHRFHLTHEACQRLLAPPQQVHQRPGLVLLHGRRRLLPVVVGAERDHLRSVSVRVEYPDAGRHLIDGVVPCLFLTC
ncbi:hypothetical protein Taro_024017 [Colocasia esculenta]|uniref:Uncharacterized protein n=1 Tax=Colocasia esculenta TaxID=4460 RepID=A0A843VCH1_COLES|nr:hypothetical protein [Colocasia esculenta]